MNLSNMPALINNEGRSFNILTLSEDNTMQSTTTRYAALIGPSCVDVYHTREAALQDLATLTDGWVLEVPPNSTLIDVLSTNSYKGKPLYYAPW